MKNKKINLLLLLVLASVFVLSLLLFFFFRSSLSGNGNTVHVTVNGKEIAQYDLFIDQEHTISTEFGQNHLVIRNGSVYIDEATCPEKICISTGSIVAGDNTKTIVCLPNKLTVWVD